MADAMVLATQQWLNTTYGSVTGWVTLTEDGNTGWNTVYGLRRGLQHELGIAPVSSGFGAATAAAFTAKIGTIGSSTTSQNVLRLVSGSLWCKGYSGWNFNDSVSFTNLVSSISQVRSDLGLDSTVQSIDVKLMASLMSMDAYVIPASSDGTSDNRTVQQWLNGTYSNRENFALIPCDGLYSRQIQTALLYALQYEFGMDDDTANGNFGPGTRQGLKDDAPVAQGDVDGGHRFVHLFQGALRFNGYNPPFSGTFDATTAARTSTFQSFMELSANGQGDYGTWCALLVSSGDPDRTVHGFDASQQLDAAQAQGAKDAGFTHVGRYIVGLNSDGTAKFIGAGELAGLKTAGLRLFPIEERYNNADDQMSESIGRIQGIEALERCRALGLPAGSTVFFAPTGDSISGPVAGYFTGVNASMDAQLLGKYKVGVYGTRNVCSTMMAMGKARAAFVAGMSTGWSGNMGFPMPNPWQYNQIKETIGTFAGVNFAVDHDAVSANAEAINLSGVTPPPTEKDNGNSATGFDVVYQWTISAEAESERALSAGNTILNPVANYVGFLPDFILGWLRKPQYWNASNSAAMWQAYTPEISTDANETEARGLCEAALGTPGTGLPTVDASLRDVPHMAATCLGYRDWGVDIAANKSDAGDLGGWLLDLLQLWGSYQSKGKNADLSTWATERLGVVNADGGFPYADVLADADGWLLQKTMSGDTSGLALSSAMRSIYQSDGNQRIRDFYDARFGGSQDNVSAAFSMVLDGIDVWGINLGFTTELLLKAAHASSMPSATQAEVLAHVYARFLASPGR